MPRNLFNLQMNDIFTMSTYVFFCRQEISALSTETVGVSPKHDDIGSTKQRKLSEPMVPDQAIVPVVMPQSTRAPINGTTTTNATPTPSNPQPTGNIPPDLTIMSDHDLISYINPSCFDQGTFPEWTNTVNWAGFLTLPNFHSFQFNCRPTRKNHESKNSNRQNCETSLNHMYT